MQRKTIFSNSRQELLDAIDFKWRESFNETEAIEKQHFRAHAFKSYDDVRFALYGNAVDESIDGVPKEEPDCLETLVFYGVLLTLAISLPSKKARTMELG